MFSGDARNSGALDINIRGISGPTGAGQHDGGEQALTVWRGYNGVSNNRIDPNLMGGIHQGARAARDVHMGSWRADRDPSTSMTSWKRVSASAGS